MQYDLDFFISYFEKIPEENWCTFDYAIKGTYCAYGHCGIRPGIGQIDYRYPMAFALMNLSDESFAQINDGLNHKYQQPTPKQRVLAHLYDLKKQSEAVKEVEQIINKPQQVEI